MECDWLNLSILYTGGTELFKTCWPKKKKKKKRSLQRKSQKSKTDNDSFSWKLSRIKNYFYTSIIISILTGLVT